MSSGRWMVLLVAELLFASCASGRAGLWVADSSLHVPAGDLYTGEAAIVLWREERVAFELGRESVTTYSEHEVVAIQTDQGVNAFSEVTIRVPPKARITRLAARIRSPGGVFTELPEKMLLESVASTGADAVNAKVFRFPRVEPGCVLEWSYALEYPGLYWAWKSQVDGEYPVFHYRAQVSGPKAILWAMKAYNSTRPIEQSVSGAGWTLDWGEDNIPARRGGAHRPDPSLTGPHWAFRITQFSWPRWVQDAFRDWASSLQRWLDDIDVEKKWAKGFTSDFDGSACKGSSCSVLRALQWVTSKTFFDGFEEYGDLRPLKEVVDSGHASAFEKAILLHHVLSENGVENQIAVLTRPGTGTWDATFPLQDWVNHMIVFVPAQGDLERATWVDPSCEACAPGQLPVWSLGVEAVVAKGSWRPGGKSVVEAEVRRTEGTPAPASERRSRWVLSYPGLDKERIREEREQRGIEAVWMERARRSEPKNEAARRIEERVERTKRGTLTLHDPLTCDRAAATCREAFEAEKQGEARTRGNRIGVHLAVFDSALDGDFDPDGRPRPLAFPAPFAEIQEVELVLPEGAKVVHRPADLRVRAPGLEASAAVAVSNGKAVIKREIRVDAGFHPASDYGAFAGAVRDYLAVEKGVVAFREEDESTPAPTQRKRARPAKK